MACLLWQREECRDISERWIICDMSRPRSGEQSARDIVRDAATAVMRQAHELEAARMAQYGHQRLNLWRANRSLLKSLQRA
jgi:hypothetical protein